jgi:hypothetical protein
MPYVRKSSLKPVLVAIRARLVARLTGWSEGRVKVAVRDKVPRYDGDSDVVLRVRGYTTDPGSRDKHDRRIYRQIDVIVRVRDELDEADQDSIWLEDVAAPLEEQVEDALHNWMPEDEERNFLCFEPLEVSRGTDFERPHTAAGWGQVTLVILAGIVRPMTQGELR